MQSNLIRSPFFLTFMTGALLGSTLVASRFSLTQFETQAFVSLRLMVGSLAFLAVYGLFRQQAWPRSPRLWILGGIFGLISTALTMTAYTQSLRYQSSAVTALLSSLTPIETALLAHFFLSNEPFQRKRILGALIAFAGAGLLLARGESGLAELARADWRGYAWALLGGISNAAGVVYARRFLRDDDPFVVTSIRIMVGAGIVAIGTALTIGFDLSQVQTGGLVSLLYAGIAGTFFAFLFYMTAVKQYGATTAAQSEYYVPLVAAALGVLVLGEQVSVTLLAGMALILIGLAVFK